MTPDAPRTEAGRKALDWMHYIRDPENYQPGNAGRGAFWDEDVPVVLAIEAEAAAPELARAAIRDADVRLSRAATPADSLDALRAALTDLITVAETQRHDPGSMLDVALRNARAALDAGR